jgi:hypothetical protein
MRRFLPAVLGGDGQVLDVGRERRLFTGPLRRALVLRDGGCAFPGCDRPPRWTTDITSGTGQTAAKPPYTTPFCCARTTTGSSTRANGGSASPATATRGSRHLRGSIRRAPRAATSTTGGYRPSVHGPAVESRGCRRRAGGGPGAALQGAGCAGVGAALAEPADARGARVLRGCGYVGASRVRRRACWRRTWSRPR